MINITDIENTLYGWADSVSTHEIIFAYPNAPKPEPPYVLINVLSNVSQGGLNRDETLLTDDSIDVDYSELEQVLISINVFGAGSYEEATKLKNSLNRVTVYEELFSNGLGLKSAKQIRKIPDLIDKKFEERAQFDVEFFVRSLDEENIETIQKVEITNELSDETMIIEKP